MKLSDKTSVSVPMRNLLSILGAVAIGVWAYFGVIERLNNIETKATIFETDLLKASDQKSIDQEQYLLLEFSVKQLEKMQKELDESRHNAVNIQRLRTDMEKAINDIEKLKDKIRENGSSH